MKKRIRLLPLPRMLLGGLATATLLAAATPASADNSLEYARITVGGGYSQKGHYTVTDSITRSTGVAVQKGSRFQVTNIKGAAQPTAVKTWKHYK